ncbi:HAD family phosphatase [Streptomyces sp. SB3404]|uniref:HAD family phosphatase n=2 Tax=Streptomyces boncukensis TaxID=2711219 RepID=A0A6G4X4S1_9ACTN|nr:HAD family phosphatase [Streptomyces boncukensis]
MDGTLVDTERDWLRTVAEALGADAGASEVTAYAGLPLADAGRRMAARDPALTAERATALLDRAFTARVRAGVTVQPGALRLLEQARARGVPVALVTASERAVADEVLGVLGRDRFAYSVAAGETRRGKPHPEPYRAAADALGVHPAECLAVEDTPTGVAAARAAGCRVLAVPTVPGIAPAPRVTVTTSLESVTLTR